MSIWESATRDLRQEWSKRNCAESGDRQIPVRAKVAFEKISSTESISEQLLDDPGSARRSGVDRIRLDAPGWVFLKMASKEKVMGKNVRPFLPMTYCFKPQTQRGDVFERSNERSVRRAADPDSSRIVQPKRQFDSAAAAAGSVAAGLMLILRPS